MLTPHLTQAQLEVAAALIKYYGELKQFEIAWLVGKADLDRHWRKIKVQLDVHAKADLQLKYHDKPHFNRKGRLVSSRFTPDTFRLLAHAIDKVPPQHDIKSST